jgi:cytochrome c biogenesis protein CcmG, thiol:disulfide interchange protein DsbE
VSTRGLIVFLAVLAVIGLLGYGLLSKGASAIATGDPAPDGELERLGTPAASTKLSDVLHGWTVVNFWASWCGPCRAEAPLLEDFWQAHRRQGVTVVGVDLDDASDDALAFIKRYGLTYPQLRDGDGRSWRDRFGMTGFPESFLIDPSGRLAVIRRGPVTEEVLREDFESVIEGRAAAPAGS